MVSEEEEEEEVMESLRLQLRQFPSLVVDARPSEVDRQLRIVASSLSKLVELEEMITKSSGQHAWHEEATEVLLDTFCQAHSADHMSERTKLGSWRLPFVAMLHSFTSLHLPLMRRLQLLVYSCGPTLTPVQCSALSTLLLFMSAYRVLEADLAKEVDRDYSSLKIVRPANLEPPFTCADLDIKDNHPSQNANNVIKEKLGIESSGVQIGNGHFYVRACFWWRWEACYRAWNVAVDQGYEDECRDRKIPQEMPGDFDKRKGTLENIRLESVKYGNHWMIQFWEALPIDSDTNMLWAARFAASYLRNIAVYWEHFVINKDQKETWLLPSLTSQLKRVSLVGPIFVAYIPTNLVIFLIWLRQRLTFAYQFEQAKNDGASRSGKKALALCDTVLCSPLGMMLLSTNVSVSLSKVVSYELKTGWRDLILVKCQHIFLQEVVWGGVTTCSSDGSSWGLLWKEYGGDKKRACIAITQEFLTSESKWTERPFMEQQWVNSVSDKTMRTRSCNMKDDDPSEHLGCGNKSCLEADSFDEQAWTCSSGTGESEANAAENHILQLIMELSSSFSSQSGPWFLEVAIGSLRLEEKLQEALATHKDNCESSHQCMYRDVATGLCSAHRLKSCICALPLSHSFSQDRLNDIGEVLLYCWLQNGPFTLHFAGQLLPAAKLLERSMSHKVNDQWSTILLASWVRFLNYFQPQLTLLHEDLGPMMTRLHKMQQYLSSHNKDNCQDIEESKIAARALPQLASMVLLEMMLSTTSCSKFIKRDCFMLNLACKASQQLHNLSGRVAEFLKVISKELELDEKTCSTEKNTLYANPVKKLFEILLQTTITLLSTAALSFPNLIVEMWTALEHKRRWLGHSEPTGCLEPPVHARDLQQVRVMSTSISLKALEMEFDERTGDLQMSVWGVYLELAVTLISLCPGLINDLLIHTISEMGQQKAAAVNAASIIGGSAQVPVSITVYLVLVGLPRIIVDMIVQSEITKASWTSLLFRLQTALETAFHQLSRPAVDAGLHLSNTKVEMYSYLLQLQSNSSVIR